MASRDLVERERPGRKSGIRRLVYRPGLDARGSGKQRWRDTREWSAIKDQLRRTVKRAPEVVIHVSGSRLGREDDHAAIQGVLRYMMYISRNGRLPTTDEQDARLSGRAAIADRHAAWNLDLQRMRSGRGEALHPSFNLIFSMPAATDPDKLLDAVQAFARDHYQGYQYVMALHTPETDPSKKPPAHPHVHLILRAEDQDGQRMYIRKGTLRTWREAFAAELRARGIEANATSRAERGISLKNRHAAEWHIDQRIEQERAAGKGIKTRNRAKEARFMEAAQELQDGRTEPKPWEIAMAARRRDVLRDLARDAARLRAEGDVELAGQVEQFAAGMAPLDSERRQMQRALVKQVKARLQQLGQGQEGAPPD